MNLRPFGLLAGLLTASAWGGMFPLLGALLNRLDPFWLTSIRYAGAGLALAVILLAVEGPRAFRLDRRWPLLAVLGALAIAGFNLLVLSGMKMSTPEHGSLMCALGPAFVAIIAWMRTRVAPSRIVIASIVLAFSGVAIVATKGSIASVLHGGSVAGDLLMTCGVLCFATYTALAPVFKDWTWLRFTTLSVGLGAIATLLATLVATVIGASHPPATQLDGPLVWGMIYMIFIAAVAAFILWNFAIHALGSQNTGLFFNVVPIVAFAIAIVAGHRFSAVEYLGAGLTIVALVASNLASRARRVSA